MNSCKNFLSSCKELKDFDKSNNNGYSLLSNTMKSIYLANKEEFMSSVDLSVSEKNIPSKEFVLSISDLKELIKSVDISNNSKLMSVKQVALYLNIGTTEVYKNLREYINPIMHGKKMLFYKCDIDSFIEESKRKGKLFF